MIKFFNIALLLFVSMGVPQHLVFASVATSVECPRNLTESGPKEYRSLGNYKVPNVRLKNPANAAEVLTGPQYIQKIASKYVTDLKPSNDFVEVYDQVFKAISKKRIVPLSKSKMLGEFAQELDPLFEKMIGRYPARGTRAAPNLDAWKLRYDAIADVKRMKFVLAAGVEDVENFGMEDYVRVNRADFFMTTPGNRAAQTHMPLIEYPDYIESYIADSMNLNAAQAKLYHDIPDSAPGGILSIGDIRDITSYNTWPMYLKSHDVRHIHYGLSHPLALGVMMRATRSRIPLRYTMLAGLYEGVDRVQYSQESSINKFFASEVGNSPLFPNITRNMDLEESMLMIAYLPKEKLDQIAATVSSGQNFITYANQVANWRPKIIIGTNLRGLSLTGAGRRLRIPNLDLEEDVKDMVFRFERMHLQSEALKEKLRLHPDTELTEDEKMLLWTMNFQLNPTSPEITIEGIRFKNDGRAHSYGDADAPIGIGDR